MFASNKIKTVLLVIMFLACSNSHAQQTIKVHYLGHAAFVMDFNDGIRVLTDFGTSNCWGYNSPIYGIGDLIPLIMTYSHYHDDHYDPDRVPAGVQYTLDLMDSLTVMDLNIKPVRTCETTPGVESNSSFIFEYMGFRICHLGDAQAEIMNIGDPVQQAIILNKFPERIDLLLMTIEGIYPFIPEAEMFIDLLQPGMVIPMHYWSPEYKEEFLAYLELQNDTAGKNYEVNRLEDPSLEVLSDDTTQTNIRVYGMTPAPYGETSTQESSLTGNLVIYPNPSNGYVYLTIEKPSTQTINCEVLDMLGRKVYSKDIYINPGKNTHCLDLNSIPRGMYMVRIVHNIFSITQMLIIGQ